MNKRVTENTLENAFCGDMSQAQSRFNLGYHTIKKLAKLSDAEIKIGRSVRYDFGKMEDYLRTHTEIV